MEDLLKCDICNNKFNLDNRKPLTAKCGHTYCKHCILSNKGENNNNACPTCNIPYVLSIESCISNLKLEDIIKFVFHLESPTQVNKKIIYVKPDIKRNKSPSVRSNYFTKDNVYRGIRSNTANKYSTEFRFSHIGFFGNTNTHMNVKMNKIDIDEEKNNISETIETIPINDEMNLSLEEDCKELLTKNVNENNDNNQEEINIKDEIMKQGDLEDNEDIPEEKNDEENLLLSERVNTTPNNIINTLRISTSRKNNSEDDNKNKHKENYEERIIENKINLSQNENKLNKKLNFNSSTENKSISETMTRNATYNHKTYSNQLTAMNLKTSNDDNDKKEKTLTPRKGNNNPPKTEPIIKTILPLNTSSSNANSEKSSANNSKIVINNIKLNVKSNHNTIEYQKNNNQIKSTSLYQSPKIITQSNLQSPKRKSIVNQNSPNINIKTTNKFNENSNMVSQEKLSKPEVLEKLNLELMKYLPNKNDSMTLNKRRKYEEQIMKALNNPKFQNNYTGLTLKIFQNNDFFIGYTDPYTSKPINGVLYASNGDYYEGEFVNEKKEGYGVLVYKNGTRYEGVLKNNKHHGYGKLIQLDGEVFIGEWKDGKINGHGVRYHSNGDRYIGSYVNNIRNGNGHYIFANGDSYEGNWMNGKTNGKGKFIFKNGNVYEGEFKDNIISGAGVFSMKNGDVYTGNFQNGLINGKGTLKMNNGDKYIGEFYCGKKHGLGKIISKDGNVINSGYWNMDKYVGKRNYNEY